MIRTIVRSALVGLGALFAFVVVVTAVNVVSPASDGTTTQASTSASATAVAAVASASVSAAAAPSLAPVPTLAPTATPAPTTAQPPALTPGVAFVCGASDHSSAMMQAVVDGTTAVIDQDQLALMAAEDDFLAASAGLQVLIDATSTAGFTAQERTFVGALVALQTSGAAAFRQSVAATTWVLVDVTLWQAASEDVAAAAAALTPIADANPGVCP